MSDFIQALTREVDNQMKGICRIRKVETAEALRVMQQTYRENLSDSLGTQSESYWRACLEIVDRRLQSESGFASIGARSDLDG